MENVSTQSDCETSHFAAMHKAEAGPEADADVVEPGNPDCAASLAPVIPPTAAAARRSTAF